MANEIIISTQETEIRSMLIKMMGRGLSLSLQKEGQFLLEKEDLIDIIEKIRQRITIQNDCAMSDFYGEFTFSDGVKDKIPSFEKFSEYRCLNREICNHAKLSMAFIVRFNDRGMEKQSIDIEFKAPNMKLNSKLPLFRNKANSIFGEMKINIEYTDITWANDIKNIFLDYMETHLSEFPIRQKILDFLGDRFSYALIMPFSFMLVFMIPIMNEQGNPKYKRLIDEANNSSIDKLDAISKKIDILISKSNNTLSWVDFIFPTSVMFTLAISYFFLPKIIGNFPISGTILSAEAKKKFKRYEKIRTSQSYLAIGAMIISILCSLVASNIDRFILSFF